jgi:hypothetical protein
MKRGCCVQNQHGVMTTATAPLAASSAAPVWARRAAHVIPLCALPAQTVWGFAFAPLFAIPALMTAVTWSYAKRHRRGQA